MKMKSYHYSKFILNIKKAKGIFYIRLYSPIISTQKLPATKNVLKIMLPGVLKTECFNSQNIPFSEEVKNTETGHLFEHILLEYLCEEKEKSGKNNFFFEGQTTWDWNKHKIGTYHIVIKSNNDEELVFNKALVKAASLMEFILNTYNLSRLYKKNKHIHKWQLHAPPEHTLLNKTKLQAVL